MAQPKKVKRRVPAHSGRPKANSIPKHIAEALERAWPDSVIEIPITDEAPFWDVYPKLKTSLSHVEGALLLYEREPESKPHWDSESDPDEDLPDWEEHSRSYHLFFLSLQDPKVSYETEIERFDEEQFTREEFDDE